MAGRGEHMASEHRIDAAEKQRRALELRKAGVSFEKIAEQVGYASRSGAHKAVLTALRNTLREPADELRTMELERLDRMQAALWPQVQQGHQGAIDRVLRIMQRRADLLGLDAPKEQRHTGKNGGPIQHEHRHEIEYAAFLSQLSDDDLAHERRMAELRARYQAGELVG